MKRLINSLLIVLILVTITLYSATGTPSNLIVRTDANNALLITGVTQTNPVTQGIFSSRTLRTDASGNLQVVLTGTVTPTYPMAVPASTCAAPSLGLAGNADNGIAFTATPSILNCIEGVARTTLTGSLFTTTVPIVPSSNYGTNLGSSSLGWDNIYTRFIGTPDATILALFTNGTTRWSIGTLGSLFNGNFTYTTDIKLFDTLVTWNNGAVTFTGWRLNVTDTASAAPSRLLDLQVASASKFHVTKGGVANSANGFTVDTNGVYQLSTSFAMRVAPTTPVACTSPTVTWSNGTATFQIDVGTSCTGVSTLTVTLTASTNGWECTASNITTAARDVWATAWTTTSVTFTNTARTTGLATDFVDGADIRVKCMGG